MTITVQLIPNAKRDQLVSWDGLVMKIKLTAPPVDGKANQALLRFLAKLLGVAPSRITFVRGELSRQKVLEVPVSLGEIDEAVKGYFG